ncbi:MAG: serine protein kinase RIO [Metallosphaera sp.]|nr:serine protein kinase RIO [Metallosphaera cuprina]
MSVESVLGAIASGKEAKVYPAKNSSDKIIALKIYYTSTASHKRAIRKYTSLDNRINSKFSSTKELIYGWARKEFSNLLKMYKSGVRVPEPYLLIKNVLAMEFIGYGINRSPLLAELDEVTQDIYLDVLAQVETMVIKAQLVHGDLSEYNIMVKDDKAYIIDVGQALPLKDNGSLELLARDLANVNKFFKSKGIDVIPEKELLDRFSLSSLEN